MTREEAIGYLKRADTTVGQKIKTKTAEALEMAIKALEQEPRWIPVSEGLPEKEMNCLVTDSLGKVHKATFYHALDGRESYFSGLYCVRAWMPLPEPYKGEIELLSGHKIYFKGETEGQRTLLGLHADIISADEFVMSQESEVQDADSN